MRKDVPYKIFLSLLLILFVIFLGNISFRTSMLKFNSYTWWGVGNQSWTFLCKLFFPIFAYLFSFFSFSYVLSYILTEVVVSTKIYVLSWHINVYLRYHSAVQLQTFIIPKDIYNHIKSCNGKVNGQFINLIL